jgi:hypothetical protein
MRNMSKILSAVMAVPVLAAAMSNLKLNGQNEVTVTQYPSFVVMTCDLAAAGNRAEVGIYADINDNGVFDREDRDWVWRWGYVTDGIGWFLDPSDLMASVPGDETGRDGKLQVTFPIFRRNAALFPKGTVFVELKDRDGSTALGKIIMNTAPTPPMVQGKVTSNTTGQPMPNVRIECLQFSAVAVQLRQTVSDANGDYTIMLDAGAWDMQVTVGPGVNEPAWTFTALNIGEGETAVKNIALPYYNARVEGTITTAGGLPAAGLIVKAENVTKSTSASARTDSTGSYELEIPSGTVYVSIDSRVGDRERWLGSYYPSVREATLTVPASGTVRQDFTLQPFDAFIEGTGTLNGIPLPYARIQASISLLGVFQWNSWALTGADGKYRVGVPPGTVRTLEAFLNGYSVISPPERSYTGLSVLQGQTLSGKDFDFEITPGDRNSLGGLVTGPDGLPVAGAYVAAVESETFYVNSFFIMTTGPDGRYLFDNVKNGRWRVMAGEGNGTCIPPMIHRELGDEWTTDNLDFQLTMISAVDGPSSPNPQTYSLSPNYPNPFNPETEIVYSLPANKPRYSLRISIYDLQGRLVKILLDGARTAGDHRIRWNGTDVSGLPSPSGVYVLRFQSEGFNVTRKMVLNR